MTRMTKLTKVSKNMPAKSRQSRHLGGSAFGGNFKKDLLLIDLEMTGLNVEKHEIIQIAAVLLDKKTLKEKLAFNAFAKSIRWQNRDPESMKVNGIKKEWVKNAPVLSVVLKAFHKKFKPKNVILSNYGGPMDMDFLRKAYAENKIKWEFDYHYFNLWCYFYGVLASKNLLNNKKKFTGFSLDDLVKKFKIKDLGSRHDALTDCRIEAEVLRRMVK